MKRTEQPDGFFDTEDRITTAACGIALMALLVSLFVWG